MSSLNSNTLQIKYIHNSVAMVTSCPLSANLQVIDQQVRELCSFTKDQPFTIKWIDEEHDPIVISSEMELKEAFRLHEVNKEWQLTVHVFNGVPSEPGKPCPGEDINMYRRGAKRWKKKFYLLHGHQFAARRFNRNAVCAYCKERIWGLGQQGFKCINCRLLLHRRCQGGVRHNCGEAFIRPTYQNMRSISTFSTGSTPTVWDNNGNRPTTIATNLSSETSNTLPPRLPVTVQSYKDEPRPPKQEKIIALSERESNQTSDKHITPTSDIKNNLKPGSDNLIIERSGVHPSSVPVPVSIIDKVDDKSIPIIEQRIIDIPDIPSLLDGLDIDWVQTEKHVFECATNHPFLVGLHSCFQTRSRLFFVIEFVNGGDLMFYMQRNLRLAEDYARFYAAEICIALNFLHERGIIYRDLKLDNVLMDSEGHIKLTDYGMCKEGIIGDMTTTTFCGTPNYIAPEILKGESYSFSVDWWALGVLMFEMLAGRSPWEGVGQSANPDQNTEDYLFQIILSRPIRFPRSISVRATSILNAFLQKVPTERLGCAPNSSFGDIMEHGFFKPIDWVALERKEVHPPYRPTCGGDRDLIHFDPAFTDEPVVLTPDNEAVMSRMDQTEFDGFEYVNPLLMSLDEQV
ncbi:serine/threonine kinase [Schistosoma mansoni]|uniref:serine/threonine kinase n=1 Tax=Schistosoma mansoni TaxID=6183 RepID=UPI00022DCAF7|nr:serine/threonine kinase [Schistosoma mansoni]|eukprot:XP_018655404.1 serine/threonine kinase [Schistosoma mansoni]